MMDDRHGKRPPKDDVERALRAEMVEALRAFQSKNPGARTITGLSDATGVNEDTLSRILRGIGTPSIASKRKLYQATNAEVFRVESEEGVAKIPSSLPRAQIPGVEGLLHEVRDLATKVEALRRSISPGVTRRDAKQSPGEQATARTRAENVARILGELDRELSFFKQETRQDARHVLRKLVDAKDVGYLIALLKAMYDDDAFENWIFGAQYATSGN